MEENGIAICYENIRNYMIKISEFQKKDNAEELNFFDKIKGEYEVIWTYCNTDEERMSIDQRILRMEELKLMRKEYYESKSSSNGSQPGE